VAGQQFAPGKVGTQKRERSLATTHGSPLALSVVLAVVRALRLDRPEEFAPPDEAGAEPPRNEGEGGTEVAPPPAWARVRAEDVTGAKDGNAGLDAARADQVEREALGLVGSGIVEVDPERADDTDEPDWPSARTLQQFGENAAFSLRQARADEQDQTR